MSALEEWGIYLVLFAAIGVFRLAQAWRARPKSKPPDLPDADELQYRWSLRERESPPRRTTDDIFGGEQWGLGSALTFVVLLWVLMRAC